MTYLKEQIAIAALTIRKDTQIVVCLAILSKD